MTTTPQQPTHPHGEQPPVDFVEMRPAATGIATASIAIGVVSFVPLAGLLAVLGLVLAIIGGNRREHPLTQSRARIGFWINLVSLIWLPILVVLLIVTGALGSVRQDFGDSERTSAVFTPPAVRTTEAQSSAPPTPTAPVVETLLPEETEPASTEAPTTEDGVATDRDLDEAAVEEGCATGSLPASDCFGDDGCVDDDCYSSYMSSPTPSPTAESPVLPIDCSDQTNGPDCIPGNEDDLSFADTPGNDGAGSGLDEEMCGSTAFWWDPTTGACNPTQ